MKTTRVAIVDDEPLGRQRIRELLAEHEGFEVVAEFSDGESAAAGLRSASVELLFLDVRMPGRDGFGVLAELDPARRPLVIFVTAYDEHALCAFDVEALDYLLKPFDRERFRLAVARARTELELRARAELGRRVERLGDVAQARDERLTFAAGAGTVFLRRSEIDWVRAAGNYLEVHAGPSLHLVRETLKRAHARLGSGFLRIHRSLLVNAERVVELVPRESGEADVVLADGTRLRASRGHRESLDRLGS